MVEGVTLAGISEEAARVQLCDPPAAPESLVTDAKNHLAESTKDAAICEADGFLPSTEGIEQCILRSVVDPSALGVVVTSAKCRLGAVPTVDRSPRLIQRAQAIALWCKRDPTALDVAEDASPGETGDALGDVRD